MSKLKFTSLIVLALSLNACSYTKSAENQPSVEKVTVKPQRTVAVKQQPTRVMTVDTNDKAPKKPAMQTAKSENYGYYMEPTISGKVTGDYGQGSLIRKKIKGIITDYKLLTNEVVDLQNKIKNTTAKVATNTADYFSLVAGITVRLQAGTTPGNPRLVSQWNEAQDQLENLSKNLVELNVYANEIDNNASMAVFLINAIKATYGLSGAIEEEHEELKRIEDELTYVVSKIGRQVVQVTDDINRQTSYLETERRNMQTLALAVKKGEFFGNSILNRTISDLSTLEGRQAAYDMKKASVMSKYPIITVRFAEENVDYAKMLYKAVDSAVDLKPNAQFNIIAVSPESSSMMAAETAKQEATDKANAIFRDMVKMGVPAKNITISNIVSEDVEVNEIQVFLR